jgi:hypothetical protein
VCQNPFVTQAHPNKLRIPLIQKKSKHTKQTNETQQTYVVFHEQHVKHEFRFVLKIHVFSLRYVKQHIFWKKKCNL